MTRAEALTRLGETASAAVLAALAERGEEAAQGEVRVVEEAGSAFDGFELPVLTSTAGDAESPRATLVLTTRGAARLAAAAAGEAAPADGDDPEVAAAREPMNALTAAAAVATDALLGRDELPAPETRRAAEADPAEAWAAGACVVIVSLTVCDEPAALVLVVPAELVERLEAGERSEDAEACGTEGAIASDSLREVRVRLWAELGRTRMALGRAVGLAPGEVVELDAAVDDPVVIFVNGVRLGSGHLVVADDGEWAFRVAEVSAGPVLGRELGVATSTAEHPIVDRKEA